MSKVDNAIDGIFECISDLNSLIVQMQLPRLHGVVVSGQLETYSKRVMEYIDVLRSEPTPQNERRERQLADRLCLLNHHYYWSAQHIQNGHMHEKLADLNESIVRAHLRVGQAGPFAFAAQEAEDYDVFLQAYRRQLAKHPTSEGPGIAEDLAKRIELLRKVAVS